MTSDDALNGPCRVTVPTELPSSALIQNSLVPISCSRNFSISLPRYDCDFGAGFYSNPRISSAD
ncbi:hypothetical protein Plhal304r1_c037g0112981 [Plasmopara halstedii]